jgi:hypothetical protein
MAERPFSNRPVAPEPSPAARELLRAFREHESPSSGARQLGFAALQARLHATAPATAANSQIYAFGKAALVTVAVAATVLLAIKAVGVGVTAFADRARQPAMEAPYQGEAAADGGLAVTRAPQVVPPRGDHEGPPNAAFGAEGDDHEGPPNAAFGAEGDDHEGPPKEAVQEPAVNDATVHPLPAPSEPASRPARPRTSASAPSAADELQAELALIKQATQAKRDGRHADGLAVLREHAERFARGTFVDERMVLRAELFCAAGRTQEAEALVEKFLRERAGSALAGRMRSVCRE